MIQASQQMAEQKCEPQETDGSVTQGYVERFRATYGRAPRVLHIGNVANYAYVNAKLMRGDGIDADVIDPDFYHIMATPEWHEARVDGEYGDDFLPRWSQVDLGGYTRPDWFVQGPSQLAFAVLALRNRGLVSKSKRAAARMKFEARILAGDFGARERWFWTTRAPLVRLVRGPMRALMRAIDRDLLKACALETPLAHPDDGLDFIASYRGMADLVSTALSSYDFVIGYTVSGVFAATAQFDRYCTYELGTLRGLPFEDSDLGRLTRWLYQSAPEVFVTNVDCIGQAHAIGIGDERLTPTLHAYDLLMMATPRQSRLKELPSTSPIFFAPARHHWRDGNSSWLKGNHIYLKALGILAKEGHDFHLVTVNWGNEVDLSKALVAELGLTRHVTWIGPQSRPCMCDWFDASCAVIDQFNAAAFGGAALDAMACGKRLVTRYDAQAGAAFFSSTPSIQSCNTPEEVAEALREILLDRDDKAGVGLQLQAWMAREHGVKQQLAGQFNALERLLHRFPLSAK